MRNGATAGRRDGGRWPRWGTALAAAISMTQQLALPSPPPFSMLLCVGFVWWQCCFLALLLKNMCTGEELGLRSL